MKEGRVSPHSSDDYSRMVMETYCRTERGCQEYVSVPREHLTRIERNLEAIIEILVK